MSDPVSSLCRHDGRTPTEKRPTILRIESVNRHAEGACLIETGDTRVLCLASVEEKVPPHLRGQAQGWVTAEYGMLPRATHTRGSREAAKGKQSGRTLEIQRLIGRSLRAVCDLRLLGERSITIDCDVLQADGGTRTASITGAWVALALAVNRLQQQELIGPGVLRDQVAAISLGMHQGTCLLDLNYEEDSAAEVDLNLIMTGSGRFVELQGTAEGHPFSQEDLLTMIESGRRGIKQLLEAQRQALGPIFEAVMKP
jgi:ribonuclease PH